MTGQPPEWRIETTAEFDDDYAALAQSGGRLPELWEGWSWYLKRSPVVHSSGLLGVDDDDCRLMTGSDERAGVEYVMGVSLDRQNHTVLVRWLDSCEFEPDFGPDFDQD